MDVDRIAVLVPGESVPNGHISIDQTRRVAQSAFDVDRALASSAAYSIAGADTVGTVRGLTAPERDVDLAHLLAFCTTHVEIDGSPVPAWADLSGVYPTADGRHLQIHCNFDHHAAGVVARLGCEATAESVGAAIAQRDAFDLEADLIADGMIGAVVRSLDEWDSHPHAAATRDLPLMSVEQIGDADPIIDQPVITTGRPEGSASTAGLRVLDCSRVLAGPVAGLMLASFGADVMRLGADHLPSVPVGVMATGFGKRNASLDLRTEPGRDALGQLLAGADVWIDAYRPGAMAGHGFTPERAASERPGSVVVQVCAFDWVGPWAGRRGFDSIVQSTTGIRAAGGDAAVDADGAPADRGPLGLPVQALDYATGFLAAGLAAQLVAHQRRVGGSWLGRVSLLRTRDWLVSMGGPDPFVPTPIAVDDSLLHEVDSSFGRLRTVRPFAGHWATPPEPLGSSEARW